MCLFLIRSRARSLFRQTCQENDAAAVRENAVELLRISTVLCSRDYLEKKPRT